MKKEDIKTLEDANKFIAIQEGTIATLTKERDDATKIANESTDQLNDLMEKAPKDYSTKVKGLGKVLVNFGVDGISKDDLLNDADKIKALHKIGSGAVTLVEPEKAK